MLEIDLFCEEIRYVENTDKESLWKILNFSARFTKNMIIWDGSDSRVEEIRNWTSSFIFFNSTLDQRKILSHSSFICMFLAITYVFTWP